MKHNIDLLNIQITDKCDFECDHCMFSCNSKGKHMNPETVQEVKRIMDTNDYEIYSINFFLVENHS